MAYRRDLVFPPPYKSPANRSGERSGSSSAAAPLFGGGGASGITLSAQPSTPIASKAVNPHDRSFFQADTEEQLSIYEWVTGGSGNGIIEAVAGSGKTYTLVNVCRVIPPSEQIAFIAFSRDIFLEIEARTALLRNVTPGTVHRFGNRSMDWRPAIKADDKKKAMLAENSVPDKFRQAIPRLVALAKLSAAGVAWDIEDIRGWESLIRHHNILLKVPENGLSERATIDALYELGLECLRWSDRAADTIIDFDDQMWIPLYRNLKLPQYPWLLIDEYQDFNVCRRLIAQKMLAPGGRALFAGDRRQAIFGFTGADADSCDNIRCDFNATVLPLTVSWRCSKTAVRLAQKYVPEIQAAPNAREGFEEHISYLEFLKSARQFDQPGASNLCPRPGDFVICRNTRPVVQLALQMVAMGIPAHVEGRDIGKNLIDLIGRWKSVVTLKDLWSRLEKYKLNEIERLTALEDEIGLQYVLDKIDCIHAIGDGCATLSDLRDKILRLFQDTEEGGKSKRVTCMTAHKSKGLQTNRVYVLGFEELMPSRMAKQGWEMAQEENLIYVTETRTEDGIVFVGLPPKE